MHLDQLLFILLIAVAALFQLLTKAATKTKENSDQTDEASRSALPTAQPHGRPPADTDEERIRRFLEALGQPTSSRPPPAVAPRIDIPPRPLAPVRPPPGMFSGGLPRRLHDQIGAAGEGPRNKTVSTPARTLVEPASAYREEVRLPEVGSPKKDPSVGTSDISEAPAVAGLPSSADTSIDIASLLASPQGLRQMVVLREIFDTPRGLQAFDFIGSA